MHYSLKNSLTVLAIVVVTFSCDRMDYFPSREFEFTNTVVLMHRASGHSTDFRENTLEAATYGLNNLDGIEVDVAISKDYGLWLSHDSKVKSIDKNFINVTDEEIRSITAEDGTLYYNRLEEVLSYMSALDDGKYISLDVKYPAELFTGETFTQVSEKIGRLVKKHHLEGKVFVESNSLSFLKNIRDLDENIETYYMCFGNYEKGIGNAYQSNLTGISFDYGRDDELIRRSVELAHNLNIKVLAYTINDAEIDVVYNLGVDIIETDHVDFYDLLDTE